MTFPVETIRVGHEGFFAFTTESSFLAANNSAVGALPSGFVMAGKTDVPRITTGGSAQEIDGAGAYEPLDLVPGPRMHTFAGNVTLSASRFTLLDYALRSGTAPAGALHGGLPVLCIATGAVSDYQAGHAYSEIGRYALINTLTLTAQEGQPVRAAVELWPLCKQESSTTFAAASLGQNFGQTLTWNELSYQFGSVPFLPILSGFTFGINNMLQRVGVRTPQMGGNSAETGYCAVDIRSLGQSTTFSFQSHSRIPDAQASAVQSVNLSAYGSDANGDGRTYGINIAQLLWDENSSQGGQPRQSVMGYSTTFKARGVTSDWG